MTKNKTPPTPGRQPIYDEPMTRKTLYLPQWMWEGAAEKMGMSPQKAVRAIIQEFLFSIGVTEDNTK